MRLRKLIIGVAAIGMPLTVMSTVVGIGAAWASTGTGTYNCSKVSGTITFKPPLTNKGGKAEVTTVKTTASTCSGTAKPKPTKVTGTATIKSSSNACANLAGSKAISLKLTYSPTVTASTLTGSASESISGTSVTFLVSGKVTGSYPSSSASGKGKLKQTTSQLATACASSTGLKSATIASGSLTNF